MKVEKTNRGFQVIRFKDLYGESCSLQDSSLATEETIWLGVDDNRMHLTRELCARLIPYLEDFVENGDDKNWYKIEEHP